MAGFLARAQNDSEALAVHLQRGAVNLPDFAWARQLNGEGMRELLQQPGYIQAGYSLLNAPVAARWQRKILDTLATYHEQHRDERLGTGANVCDVWRCQWKMKR